MCAGICGVTAVRRICRRLTCTGCGTKGSVRPQGTPANPTTPRNTPCGNSQTYRRKPVRGGPIPKFVGIASFYSRTEKRIDSENVRIVQSLNTSISFQKLVSRVSSEFLRCFCPCGEGVIKRLLMFSCRYRSDRVSGHDSRCFRVRPVFLQPQILLFRCG